MEIIQTFPPIYAKANAVFHFGRKIPIFTYGDMVYNPAGLTIDKYYLAHEAVHALQQKRLGMTPEIWWDTYLSDNAFRMDQEREAYYLQYSLFCRETDDQRRQQFMLRELGNNFAYGYNLGLGIKKAMKQISSKPEQSI